MHALSGAFAAYEGRVFLRRRRARRALQAPAAHARAAARSCSRFLSWPRSRTCPPRTRFPAS